jgi:hypothetical protein
MGSALESAKALRHEGIPVHRFLGTDPFRRIHVIHDGLYPANPRRCLDSRSFPTIGPRANACRKRDTRFSGAACCATAVFFGYECGSSAPRCCTFRAWRHSLMIAFRRPLGGRRAPYLRGKGRHLAALVRPRCSRRRFVFWPSSHRGAAEALFNIAQTGTFNRAQLNI